jgi:uncharacterized membrane protein HdeD (DUF308 family)
MDTKLSCYVWGIIGVIFGILALLFPEQLQLTFFGLFLILIGVVIVVFLFLAITSKSDESLFWFGLSAGLLIIGVISLFAQVIVEIIFLLMIAALVFYNGFTDIVLALKNPRTKYILIPAMFLSGVALLAVLIKYIPQMSQHLVIITLGSFALVFGLFSIIIGYYQEEEPEADLPVVQLGKTCEIKNHEK